jgi:hypothetical protein
MPSLTMLNGTRVLPRRCLNLGECAGFIRKGEPVQLLAHAGLALRAPMIAGPAHAGVFLFADPQRFSICSPGG